MILRGPADCGNTTVLRYLVISLQGKRQHNERLTKAAAIYNSRFYYSLASEESIIQKRASSDSSQQPQKQSLDTRLAVSRNLLSDLGELLRMIRTSGKTLATNKSMQRISYLAQINAALIRQKLSKLVVRGKRSLSPDHGRAMLFNYLSLGQGFEPRLKSLTPRFGN